MNSVMDQKRGKKVGVFRKSAKMASTRLNFEEKVAEMFGEVNSHLRHFRL